MSADSDLNELACRVQQFFAVLLLVDYTNGELFSFGEQNVKLAVMDFEKACLCIYVVTPEMCNNEDEIVDYIVELGHNIDMVQYMYGEFEIKSDIIVE
jgi:hypothetical protein